MDEPSSTSPSRIRAIEEAVLAVHGVATVRVWENGTTAEIGIRVAPLSSPSDVLHAVEELIETLHTPYESCEVGIVNE
ncbi:MAG: hypothetical protein Q8Q09_02115 [Deltaproteobacteria bacterium]|nr:hypothetical protein [Deltaproteobacteria bacterium]